MIDYEKLEKLADLWERGVLTDDEFHEQKSKLLEANGSQDLSKVTKTQMSNSRPVNTMDDYLVELQNKLVHPQVTKIEKNEKGQIVIAINYDKLQTELYLVITKIEQDGSPKMNPISAWSFPFKSWPAGWPAHAMILSSILAAYNFFFGIFFVGILFMVPSVGISVYFDKERKKWKEEILDVMQWSGVTAWPCWPKRIGAFCPSGF